MTGSLERYFRLGPDSPCPLPFHTWTTNGTQSGLPWIVGGAHCLCGAMVWTGYAGLDGPPYVTREIAGLFGPRTSWHVDGLDEPTVAPYYQGIDRTQQQEPMTCGRRFDPHEPRLTCVEDRGHAGPCSRRNTTHPYGCKCETCELDRITRAFTTPNRLRADRDTPADWSDLDAARDVRIAEDRAIQRAQAERPHAFIGADKCLTCGRSEHASIHQSNRRFQERLRCYSEPHPYLPNALDMRPRWERRCIVCGQSEFALVHQP